jgi:hypothetical protein
MTAAKYVAIAAVVVSVWLFLLIEWSMAVRT